MRQLTNHKRGPATAYLAVQEAIMGFKCQVKDVKTRDQMTIMICLFCVFWIVFIPYRLLSSSLVCKNDEKMVNKAEQIHIDTQTSVIFIYTIVVKIIKITHYCYSLYFSFKNT